MTHLVRITKTGRRYLVFDVKDVAALRREHCICAVFIGTTPQNPNQNVFSGLPLELLPEEARLLVDKGAAYIVDDAVSHLTQLSTMDPVTRQSYLQSLKTRQRAFQRVADEQEAERRKHSENMRTQGKSKRAPRPARQESPAVAKDDELLFGDSLASVDPQPKANPPATNAWKLRHITPTTSIDLLADLEAETVSIQGPQAYPFYKHLNSKGYYITPGIRFGADYSVYPGDPFRYHAHFMATNFGWDEEITVLDLVSGGRLGTGVKKGFLIGGAFPSKAQKNAEEVADDDRVRAFTLEWAAM